MSMSLQKLSRFSLTHLSELSSDIHDEICRRQNASDYPQGYLPYRNDIHVKRNNARRQFSTLSVQRFGDMCRDVIAELERRFPQLRAVPVPAVPESPEIPEVSARRPSLANRQRQLEQEKTAPVPSAAMLRPDTADSDKSVRQVFQSEVNPVKSVMVEDDSGEDSDEDFDAPSSHAGIEPGPGRLGEATLPAVDRSDFHFDVEDQLGLNDKESTVSAYSLPVSERTDNSFVESLNGDRSQPFYDLNRPSSTESLRTLDRPVLGDSSAQEDGETREETPTPTIEHSQKAVAEPIVAAPIDARAVQKPDSRLRNSKLDELNDLEFENDNRSSRQFTFSEFETSYKQGLGIYESDVAHTENEDVLEEPTELLELQDQVRELEEFKAQAVQENAQLHDLLADTEVNRRRAEEITKTWMQKFNDLQAQLPDYEEKARQIETERDEKLQQYEQLAQEHEKYKTLYTQLSEEKELMQGSGNGSMDELERLRSDFEDNQLKYAELLEEYNDLQEKYNELLSSSKQKYNELLDEYTGKQEELAALEAQNAELSTGATSRDPELETKHAALSQEHESLKLRLASIAAEHRDVSEKYASLLENHEDIQQQYSALEQNGSLERGIPRPTLQSEYDQLLQQHEVLKEELEKQQTVTDQVRNEAMLFMKELREMSSTRGSSSAVVKELQKQVLSLQAEVKDWKSRYAKAMDEVREGRSFERGSQILQPEAIESSKYIAANGLVTSSSLQRFQDSVTDMLFSSHRAPEKSIDSLHKVIIATEALTGQFGPQDTKFAQNTRLVNRCVNQLISTVKNLSTTPILFPAAVVSAACSDLCYSVAELAKQAKVKQDSSFTAYREPSRGSVSSKSPGSTNAADASYYVNTTSRESPEKTSHTRRHSRTRSRDVNYPDKRDRSTPTQNSSQTNSARTSPILNKTLASVPKPGTQVFAENARDVKASPQRHSEDANSTDRSREMGSTERIQATPTELNYDALDSRPTAEESSPAKSLRLERSPIPEELDVSSPRAVRLSTGSGKGREIYYEGVSPLIEQATVVQTSGNLESPLQAKAEQPLNRVSLTQERAEYPPDIPVLSPPADQNSGLIPSRQDAGQNPGDAREHMSDSSENSYTSARRTVATPSGSTSGSPRQAKHTPISAGQPLATTRSGRSPTQASSTYTSPHAVAARMMGASGSSREARAVPPELAQPARGEIGSSEPSTPAEAQHNYKPETPKTTRSDTESHTPKIQSGRASRIHRIAADSSIAELQAYLEEQTSETVDSIRELLSGIKVDAIVNELLPRVESIVYYVDLMVSITGTSMRQTKNWLLKDKGSFILQSLDDCCRRMASLSKDLNRLDGEKTAPRPLKQRLAGVSFDMAKCTKELVKTVEDVSLKSEIYNIDSQLEPH